MKLISVERSIQVFYRKSDELVIEYPLQIELDILKQIIKGMKNDKQLYLSYHLSKSQTIKILSMINLDVKVEMKTYRYFLDCTGIYEESK